MIVPRAISSRGIAGARVTFAAPLCAFVMLLQASTAGAQIVGPGTGAIDGKVIDRTGEILTGVTIHLTSQALIGTRTTRSEHDGTYRFPGLPPGTYLLEFVLGGFQPATRAGVRVILGVTTTVQMTLDVGARTEEIIVEGSTRAVDRHSTMKATNFDSFQLAQLPGSRNLAAILSATPALQMTRFDVGGSAAFNIGTFSAYGTTGYSRPTVEGMSVANMNPFGFALDYGAFDAVSVGTGAYGPEWPSPGVHVQILTKSGSNLHRGSLSAEYESRNWQAHNIDDDQIARGATGSERVPAREANRLREYADINADAGGFVRKDRLWWYGSLRRNASSSTLVIFPITPLETIATSISAKGTLRMTDGSRLVLFAHRAISRQPIRLDGFLRAATAVNLSEESTTEQIGKGVVWKAEWSAVLRAALFFDVRVGQFVASRSERPNGAAARFEDVIDPIVSGGNRNWLESLRRDQINGSLNYFRSGHHLKAGGEILRDLGAETWRQAYPGDVLHVLQRGAPHEVYLFQTPSRSESGQWWYAGFVHDSWQANERLTLNVGLRFDRFRTFLPEQEHPAGRFNLLPQKFAAVPNIADWNVVAPRLGASFDLAGDGTTILKAGFGRYWLPVGTDLGFNANPNSRVWWQRFKWSDTDTSGVWEPGEHFELQEQRGGEPVESLDAGLKLAFINEITAGIERELVAGLSLQTGVVWRGERQQGARQRASWPFEAFTIAKSLPDPGPDGAVGTGDDGSNIPAYDQPADLLATSEIIVRNPPLSASNHFTWEVTAHRRFNRQWSLFATLAHMWHREHARAYAGQPMRANEYPLTPNDLINTDEGGRHRFKEWSAKIYGTYDGIGGIRITPFLRHQSGQAFGRTFVARLNYGAVRILAEPVATRRQENITLLDLRVEKDLLISGARRLSAFVDVLNLFNANTEQNIDWTSGTSFLKPLAIVPPRIAKLGVRLEW